MQYKFFYIPAIGTDSNPFEEELNRFLRGHRVLSVKREFVPDASQSCWCICVEYLDGQPGQEQSAWQARERVDYRDVLSEEAFAKFARMRSVRKSIADDDHIPAYAIMKDEMMAELSKLPEVDEKALKALQGFGEKKFEKYGLRFLELLKKLEEEHEADGKSVSENQ